VIKIPPATRIAIGLLLLTLSILLAADMFGVTPNTRNAILEARQKVCESLAIQFAVAAQHNDLDLINNTLRASVERNEDMLSAALRGKDGSLLLEAGLHTINWPIDQGTKSTPNYVQVPIFKADQFWGVVEIRFSDINPKGFMGLSVDPIYPLLCFVAITGFFGFRYFMTRTLKQLDPTSLIPGRVKHALDALTEGVILLDEKGRIVLVNTAFLTKTGKRIASIMGENPSKWDWVDPKTQEKLHEIPWLGSLKEGINKISEPMAIKSAEQNLCTFVVNSSPILGGKDEVRGALVTFNDVTELEKKNEELHKTLGLLKASQNKVRKQNKHLQQLASQDPLTGCLNRRAFFEKADADYNMAKLSDTDFVCVMTDIDLFKSVNDQYGHGAGDEVIKTVSAMLKDAVNKHGIVCRYGGEEFCIILTGMTLVQSMVLFEGVRNAIEDKKIIERKVTCSFGVSSIKFGAENLELLIDQADKALYEAKETGRNKIVRWDRVSPKSPTGNSTNSSNIASFTRKRK